MKTLPLLIMALMPLVLTAQNWTGNMDSDWNNSSNWSSWPLNGQDIVIDPALYTGTAASPIITSNSVFTPAAVLMQNGAQLIVNANLTSQDDIEVLGTGTHLTVTGGTLNVNPGNGGRLIIDLAAEMTLNGGTVLVDERFIAGEDALVYIDSGTASSGERLLMDLGGKFIQTGGNVSVAQTFAMADGSVTNFSGYELHGGQLSITGEMAFENEAGNFEPTFLMTSGTLIVNGDVSWFGEAPGSGTPKFIMTGGNATINGNIQNLVLSTVFMYLSIQDSAQMEMTGALVETIHTADSIIQKGNAMLTFSGSNTVSNVGVLLGLDGVTTHFNGTSTLSGSGEYNMASMQIPAAGSLFLQQDISVKNNISCDGGMTTGLSRVSFTGDTEQFISGSTQIDFYDLLVDNTSADGISLITGCQVTDSLILIDGTINTLVSNLITVSDNAVSTEGNDSSFVNGPMIKIGNDDFVFPVGKDQTYARLAISAPSTPTSSYRVEYFDQPYTSTIPVNSPLTAVSPSEYWAVSKSNSSDQVQITLYWEDAALSGITDCSETTIASWNTAWDNILSVAAGNCSGNGSGTVQSTAAVGNTDILTFGYFGNVTTEQYDICLGDSVVINGVAYYTTETVLNTYMDVNGDDSTVISHVTVIQPSTYNQTLDICAGDSVQVGSSYYSATGFYTDTLVSAQLCDSIVYTNLTVTPSPDLAVTVGIITLTATANATQWQWVDCSNAFFPIPGATDSVLTVVQNGSYACIITFNNCSDTTDCFFIHSIGLTETVAMETNLYPNPTDRLLTIESDFENGQGAYEITDLSGRLCRVGTILNNRVTLDISDLKKGTYIVNVLNGNNRISMPLIKL